MMQYLSFYAVYALFDGVNWVNINADIVSDIDWGYGIKGGGPTDRLGDPGEIKFILNNTSSNSAGLEGYYTPGHGNCRAGFAAGLKIALRTDYDGKYAFKFYGEIPPDGIDVKTGRLSKKTVKVVAKDWMFQAYNHELITPTFAQNKSIEEVAALILANMSKQPYFVNYRMGEEIFGSVFDTVKSTTRAASELAKLALSEFGFIYINHKSSWETLRVEGRYSRAEEVPTPTIIPVASVDSEELLTEAGDVITDESDDPILVDAAEIPTFDNSQADLSAPYGKIMANRVKLVAYPRIVDAAATTILFSLNNPIYLAPGATFPFTGRYRHPSGTYTNVAGINMKTPMTTPGEYLMNAAENGSGADLSADLTVTPTYGTGDVTFSLHNGGASGGYVIKCDAVGRGVYTPDPVDFTAEDAVSIAAVGPYPLTIDMKYQDDPSILEGLANVILAQVKDPRVIPETIKFYPNRSGRLMNAFLWLEPGDRIPVIEDVSATNAEYFINGVESKIKRGGVIQCTYYLRNAAYDTYESGEWDVDDWDADAATWAL